MIRIEHLLIGIVIGTFLLGWISEEVRFRCARKKSRRISERLCARSEA